MALRRSPEPLRVITVRVFAEDHDWLRDTFSREGPTPLGPDKALRLILRRYRRRHEAHLAKGVTALADLNPSEPS